MACLLPGCLADSLSSWPPTRLAVDLSCLAAVQHRCAFLGHELDALPHRLCLSPRVVFSFSTLQPHAPFPQGAAGHTHAFFRLVFSNMFATHLSHLDFLFRSFWNTCVCRRPTPMSLSDSRCGVTPIGSSSPMPTHPSGSKSFLPSKEVRCSKASRSSPTSIPLRTAPTCAWLARRLRR